MFEIESLWVKDRNRAFTEVRTWAESLVDEYGDAVTRQISCTPESMEMIFSSCPKHVSQAVFLIDVSRDKYQRIGLYTGAGIFWILEDTTFLDGVFEVVVSDEDVL